jgi:hypothetical protein
MYKLLIWKSVMDHHGPNTKEESYIMNYKPTFEELYKHLDCSMIEILSGYDKNISNRTFDMYCDEESKLKTPIVKNKRATDAWYAWQDRTKRQCVPGDFIAGNVAVIKKVKDEAA